MYADKIQPPKKLSTITQRYSYAILPPVPPSATAPTSAATDPFSTLQQDHPSVSLLDRRQLKEKRARKRNGSGNQKKKKEKVPAEETVAKVPSAVAGDYSPYERDHVIRVLISDARLADSSKAWQDCWRKCSLVHVVGGKAPVRAMERNVLASLRHILLLEKSSEKKWIVMVMAGFYNIMQGNCSAKSVLRELLDLKKAVLKILPPGTVVVLGTVPGVYKKQVNDQKKLKMFNEVNDMITKKNQSFNKDVSIILSNHGKKRFSEIVESDIEITKMVEDIHKSFLLCTQLVIHPAVDYPAVAAPPGRESSRASVSASEEAVPLPWKSDPHCFPADKDSHTQPKETKAENNSSNIYVLHEDHNVEVVYVSSQGGVSTEKASFIMASDNRLRNIRLAWTAEFPLVHVLGKEMPVRDLHEGFITALTRLLVEESLSSDRRLVVVLSAGSYNIIRGCHDPDSIMAELLDLRKAIERVLPPGAITVLCTLPCTSGKGLTKKAQAKASEMFTQVNQLITEHYRQQIPTSAVKVISVFDTKRVSVVLTKAEIAKFTHPLEQCCKYFSAPAVCCFCLVLSSKLSASYTKGSFCMACDACLMELSAPELPADVESDSSSAKDSEQSQVPSRPGEEEEDLGWKKIFQMKEYLKDKEVFTLVSLSDALAGLLAVAFDKDLFVLLKKVLREEAKSVKPLSSCTYNDIALLGITGERAVNLTLNRHVPKEQGELLIMAAVIIRDCLQSLASRG
ncbi:uncharacterized protein LOC125046148 [Penaeus chinensis]|uniref:uncharacterized protein LOC125046148 n=1 Tax=Penaeus chinensis TaxID=139456 RepID=UPI001FB665E6|nr:uncharacterized protein LOC125046148 [Penaeus chinensis]